MKPDLLGDNAPAYDKAHFPPARVFQDSAHEALRDGARAKHKRQVLMSPTGSGKTYLGLRACLESLVKGRRAIFIADRITLIDQTSETANRYGMGVHGVHQADHVRTDPDLPFQIASTQTMATRGVPPGLFDLAIIDECHTRHKGWLDFLDGFEGHVIGLSATPFAKGMGKIFTNLVNAATMAQLVDEGVLVPLRVLSCIKPNMKGAKTSDGEWTQKSAEERGLAIVGDVVDEWLKHAENRKTICFGATIAHCEELCRQFNERGVMAAVFCADTTPAERAAILKDYRRPDSTIRILVSVEALAKGFDVQDVGCIIDCRPLRKGLSTFIQMVGRGLRCSPDTGKVDCLLLDHSGNIVRFAEDFSDIYWNGLSALSDDAPLDASIRKDEEGAEKRACPKCGYVPFAKRCISCGFEMRKASTIEHEASLGMREIIIGKRRLADNREHLYRQFVSHAIAKGSPNPKGWAANLYKEAMGVFPPSYFSFEHAAAANVPVTSAVHDRIRSRLIAYRNARKAA